VTGINYERIGVHDDGALGLFIISCGEKPRALENDEPGAKPGSCCEQKRRSGLGHASARALATNCACRAP
jgi:hypothetical protein